MIKNFLSLTVSAVFLTLTAGCLETRNSAKEQEEKTVLKKQVANLQQSTADVNQRFSEIEDDQRKFSGRQEALEQRLAQLREKHEKTETALEGRTKDQDAKLAAFREEIEKVKHELSETKAALVAAQNALQGVASGSTSAPASSGKSANAFDNAEAKFEAKQYRDAIFGYEDYRKNYPKGKHFASATLKIGISFQELGMADDAKPFYEEVIAKAPKSKEAEKARAKLKALGKKR